MKIMKNMQLSLLRFGTTRKQLHTRVSVTLELKRINFPKEIRISLQTKNRGITTFLNQIVISAFEVIR